MIRLISYQKPFADFLSEGAHAIGKLDKRPSVIGLLLSPIYGDLYLSLHFGTVDPLRPPVLTEFDHLEFSAIHFPEWEHEYWNGSQCVELSDGSVRDLRNLGATEYCRPFMEYFTPQFDLFWSASDYRSAADWLACEVVGCDPFHIWIPGAPPIDYYPKSIFVPGPPLNGQ